MKKQELQKILKPLIEECIKEVIFEEGVLSNLIKEVAAGLGPQQTIVEAKAEAPVQDFSRQAVQLQEEQSSGLMLDDQAFPPIFRSSFAHYTAVLPRGVQACLC